MVTLRLQDGKIIIKDGKIGTEQSCCCQHGCCEKVTWHRVYGECNNLEDNFLTLDVGEDCYAYYTWEDWDCQNELVGRDCGDGGEYFQCNIYARVKVVGNVPGQIEYLQSSDPDDVWGPDTPGGFCGCPDSFGSLSVECCDSCETNCDCGTYFVTGQGCVDLEGINGSIGGVTYYSMALHLTVEWRGLTLPNVGGQDIYWGGPDPRWNVGATIFFNDPVVYYSGLTLSAGPISALGEEVSNTTCYKDGCDRTHLRGIISVNRPSDDQSCTVQSAFEWDYKIACEDDPGGQATVTLVGESSTCDSGNDTPVVTLSFMP